MGAARASQWPSVASARGWRGPVGQPPLHPRCPRVVGQGSEMCPAHRSSTGNVREPSMASMKTLASFGGSGSTDSTCSGPSASAGAVGPVRLKSTLTSNAASSTIAPPCLPRSTPSTAASVDVVGGNDRWTGRCRVAEHPRQNHDGERPRPRVDVHPAASAGAPRAGPTSQQPEHSAFEFACPMPESLASIDRGATRVTAAVGRS